MEVLLEKKYCKFVLPAAGLIDATGLIDAAGLRDVSFPPHQAAE
jgi:hypothetical protein